MAPATKSLRTRSNRKRSLIPQAVANRRQLILKFESASGASSVSAHILDFAYAVRGLSGESSVRASSSAYPYTLQLEANTKDLTPACFASFAARIHER